MVIEVLETRSRSAADRRTTLRRLLLGVGALFLPAVLVLALGRSGGGPEAGVLAPAETPTARHLLVVGDASVGEEVCAGCVTYARRFAAALQQASGSPVRLDDRTWRTNVWPPVDVYGVLAYLNTDPDFRRAVASADALLLEIGEHDLPHTRRDDPCGLRADRASPSVRVPDRRCAARTTAEFRDRLDRLLTLVSDVRGGRPLVLRLVTVAPYDPAPGPAVTETADRARRQLSRAQCQVVRRHGGACLDLRRLGEGGQLSTTDWRPAATGMRLTQRGHDVVAYELLDLGLNPGR